MVATIKGKRYWLWRAVVRNGYVLDALLESRRNKAATLWPMRKLLKHQGVVTRVMVTDKLSLLFGREGGVDAESGAPLIQRIEPTELKIFILLCDDESGASCASSRRDRTLPS